MVSQVKESGGTASSAGAPDVPPDRLTRLDALRPRLMALDSLAQGVVVLDGSFTVYFWNRPLEQWTGIEARHILGRDLRAMYPYLGQGFHAEKIRAVLAGGGVQEFSPRMSEQFLPLELPQGGLRRTKASAALLPDAGGALVLVSIEDLSRDEDRVQKLARLRTKARKELEERKRAAEALREKELQLQTILGSMQSGVILADCETAAIEAVNPYASALIGLPAENLVGLDCHAFLRIEQACGRDADDGQDACMREDVLFDHAGRPIPVIRSVVPICQSGRMFRLESFTDITELKKAQEELARSEERLKNLYRRAPVGIYQSLPNGRYLSANPALARLYGYESPEQMLAEVHDIGRQVYVDPSDRESFIALLREKGRVVNRETRRRCRDGRVIWVSTSATAVMGDDGRLSHYEGFCIDITERKQLEGLREEVDRIMRHDLKSPLNGIIAGPQLLLESPGLSPEHAEILRMIQETGRKMLNMINMSLDLYKMETGTYRFMPRVVDLMPVLRSVRRDLREVALARDAIVYLNLAGVPATAADRLLVVGDDLLCYTVFSNLVLNALEAVPEGGAVTVDAVSAAGEILVTVHNMGAVPKDVRENFFEKYSTSGKRHGTGIGTYSAKLMVEAQKGRIAMRTSEAEGTTLSVALPVPAATETA